MRRAADLVGVRDGRRLGAAPRARVPLDEVLTEAELVVGRGVGRAPAVQPVGLAAAVAQPRAVERLEADGALLPRILGGRADEDRRVAVPREPALLVLFSLPLVQTHPSGLKPVPAVDFDEEKVQSRVHSIAQCGHCPNRLAAVAFGS